MSKTSFWMQFSLLKGVFKSILMASTILILMGCGGGGGSDSNEVPTIQEISGTYELTHFNVRFNTGATVGPDDVNSWSGEMFIYTNGSMTQEIIIEGTATSTSAQILEIDDGAMRLSSAGFTYWLDFSYGNNQLVTVLPTNTIGNNYSETDYWKKVSSETPRGLILDNDEINYNANVSRIGFSIAETLIYNDPIP